MDSERYTGNKIIGQRLLINMPQKSGEELGTHGVKIMKILKNNTVLLECRRQKQKALILKQIWEKENVQISDSIRFNPKIVLKYVRKDMDEDELIDDLIYHNEMIRIKYWETRM
ncbi:hypothetical protein GWI33_015618 [Rhynchophorus ferrugineus]|uniref:Uncharacterized protein n=1 Tax=Rhynchophorus ferrugineus TaxID=354439 RepID=A0A834I260_RHYFE|nr:hypothetical protein GWI33_015618 [Rhynchophorus ferrugineus]